MPDENITAWLRVKNTARYVADFAAATKATHELGDEADQTARKLRRLARSSLISRAAVARLKDHLSLTRGEFLTTAYTLGAYLSPAIVAMGASAGGALVGGAGVAGGGIAALAAGLGGIAAISINAAADIVKVKTALDAYNQAVLVSGKGSLQAANASAKLWAVTRMHGGQQILRLIKNWQALGKAWGEMTKIARANVFTLMDQAVMGLRNLLPTLAAVTNRASIALVKAQPQLLSRITGREAQSHIQAFGHTFDAIAGPLARGLGNTVLVLMRVFRAFLPYVEQLANWFERLTVSWLKGTGNVLKLEKTSAMLVSHWRSWWHLIMSVGRLIIALFKGSNAEGQRLTDSLARSIDKMAAWLSNAKNIEGVKRAFRDFGNVVREVMSVLKPLSIIFGRIALALFPAIHSATDSLSALLWVIAKRIDAVTWSLKAIGPLLGPLLTLLIAHKLATSALTAAIWLLETAVWAATIAWRALVFAGKAAVVIFGALRWAVVGLWTLIMAHPFVALAVAIGAALILAYNKVKWFRDAVDAAWAAIRQAFGWLSNRIANAPERWAQRWAGFVAFLDSVKDRIDSIRSGIDSAIGKGKGGGLLGLGGVDKFGNLFGLLGDSNNNKLMLPGKQFGGMIPIGTTAWVGEAGPELAFAGPTGTMISPISTSPPTDVSIDPVQIIRLSTSVQVSRREIARAQQEYEIHRKNKRGEK